MTVDLAVDSLDHSLLPSSIQLLRCTASRRFGGRRARLVVRPSGPLVGGLSLRAHGSGDLCRGTRTHVDGSRTVPANRRRSRGGSGVSGGPELFILALADHLDQRSSSGGQGGGDEETRTPDPLLAKEMLF